MLKYTQRIVSLLPEAAPNQMPNPFSSRAPTRLLVLWEDGKVYLGKPFEIFRRHSKTVPMHLLIEFDKSFKVASLLRRRDGNFVLISENSRLLRIYHPILTISQVMGPATLHNWLGSPQRVALVHSVPCLFPIGTEGYAEDERICRDIYDCLFAGKKGGQS